MLSLSGKFTVQVVVHKYKEIKISSDMLKLRYVPKSSPKNYDSIENFKQYH